MKKEREREREKREKEKEIERERERIVSCQVPRRDDLQLLFKWSDTKPVITQS